jgi:hypothetical protein
VVPAAESVATPDGPLVPRPSEPFAVPGLSEPCGPAWYFAGGHTDYVTEKDEGGYPAWALTAAFSGGAAWLARMREPLRRSVAHCAAKYPKVGEGARLDATQQRIEKLIKEIREGKKTK